eukprot:comp12841_c0_seq1/m.8001 comp12841_c0_seq1/g.8001  ORF comp12841_c0_seq1/g.8001 comp12841_c0_seq1/m.8001 type:complete len:165 (-) comp12841_c0_seq1:553-1047(-)
MPINTAPVFENDFGTTWPFSPLCRRSETRTHAHTNTVSANDKNIQGFIQRSQTTTRGTTAEEFEQAVCELGGNTKNNVNHNKPNVHNFTQILDSHKVIGLLGASTTTTLENTAARSDTTQKESNNAAVKPMFMFGDEHPGGRKGGLIDPHYRKKRAAGLNGAVW